MLHIKSDNYDKFHCIMGACPQSCCSGGWQIIIDDDHLAQYSKLASVKNSASEIAVDAESASFAANADRSSDISLETLGKVLQDGVNWEEEYFHIQENGDCKMLRADGLCAIQRALGETALCDTCNRYPRHMEEYEGVREWSLSLSCPEAARMILARTEKLSFIENETDEEEDLDEYEDFDDFLYYKLVDAREKIYAIIQDRRFDFRTKAKALAALAGALQEFLDNDCVFEMDELIYGPEELTAEEGSGTGELDIAEDIEAYAEAFDAAAEQGGGSPYAKDPFDKNLFSKVFELELLKANWTEVADAAWKNWDSGLELSAEQEIQAEQLMMFWIYVYFCGAVYDGCIYSKVMLAICSTWWIFQVNASNSFAGGMTEAAYVFAREIEHSDENLNALEDWFMS